MERDSENKGRKQDAEREYIQRALVSVFVVLYSLHPTVRGGVPAPVKNSPSLAAPAMVLLCKWVHREKKKKKKRFYVGCVWA